MIIYKITNLINNKVYVGMTIHSLERRWHQHASLKYSGTKLFCKAIKKYGKENFSVEQIDSATSLTELKNKEIFWIKELRAVGEFGYNIQPGGIGGRNEESMLSHRTPIVCLQTGEIFGSLSDACSKLNLEITKVSAVCRGRRDSTKGLSFEYVDSKKKENANILRNNRKDKVKQSKKRSISGYIGASKRFKPVKCIETGEIFPSIADAARKMDLFHGNIIKVLKGQHKTVEGYTFEYYTKFP